MADLLPEGWITLPRFRSAEDRDARYADWVAAGHAMCEGMFCFVAGDGPHRYTNGEWVRRGNG
jgi:hypothetical protein